MNKIYLLNRMSSNNVNALTRNFERLRVDPSRTPQTHHVTMPRQTRKRMRQVSIRKNDPRSTKRAHVSNSGERRRFFLLNKRKAKAAKEAIDSYKEANE